MESRRNRSGKYTTGEKGKKKQAYALAVQQNGAAEAHNSGKEGDGKSSKFLNQEEFLQSEAKKIMAAQEKAEDLAKWKEAQADKAEKSAMTTAAAQEKDKGKLTQMLRYVRDCLLSYRSPAPPPGSFATRFPAFNKMNYQTLLLEDEAPITVNNKINDEMIATNQYTLLAMLDKKLST